MQKAVVRQDGKECQGGIEKVRKAVVRQEGVRNLNGVLGEILVMAMNLSGASLRKPEQHLRKVRITYHVSDIFVTCQYGHVFYVLRILSITYRHVFAYYVSPRICVLRIAYTT